MSWAVPCGSRWATCFFHTPFCACPCCSLGRQFLPLGPLLGPASQRSGNRLTESAGASASTSSKAGTRLCAGPGTARARLSAVWPMACCTAVESTLQHRLAQAARAGPRTAGGARQERSATRRRTSDMAEAFQHPPARKGTERPLGRAGGVCGSLATLWALCHLQHGTIASRGPSMWGTITTKRRHQRAS